MSNYKLSILIPARNEEWLYKTVESLLTNKRGKTEVLVGLDGDWANPAIEDHPDLTVLYYPKSIGQRAMTNQLCRLSKAKYVMKIDAHCAVDEGFDVKMMEKMQDDWTMIPALYNLHVFNWKCKKCGNEWYMGPTPQACAQDREGKISNPNCDSKDFERVVVFQPRLHKRSEFYRFDNTLHFQYHGRRKEHPEAQGDIAETMSAQGSCFMLTRDKYWELNICDEDFGSWGQQGVEVACKTWLSGGRLVTNKNTWYSHMFRTQPGFGFPYPISGTQIEQARKLSRELFVENKWPLQKYPLSWLIEKFRPLPTWHFEDGPKQPLDQKMMDYVNKRGEEFYTQRGVEPHKKTPTKGIVYYTDNQLNLKISHAVQKKLKQSGLPIVSVSLKPMPKFGKNIHMKGLQRGYEAYFRQIVAGLEAIDTDIVFFGEHDWLYHPSHFEFTPPREDTFYYNWNWWRVRAKDGHAVRYDTQLLPGICGYRKLLLEYYKKQLEILEKANFDTKTVLKTGFEPGTHNRIPELSGYKVDKWESKYPNIDIRHDNNLTASKWAPDEFRNPKNAQNWKESKLSEIPGWDNLPTLF